MMNGNYEEANKTVALLQKAKLGIEIVSISVNRQRFNLALDVPAMSSINGPCFSREIVESLGAARRLILSMQ